MLEHLTNGQVQVQFTIKINRSEKNGQTQKKMCNM